MGVCVSDNAFGEILLDDQRNLLFVLRKDKKKILMESEEKISVAVCVLASSCLDGLQK